MAKNHVATRATSEYCKAGHLLDEKNCAIRRNGKYTVRNCKKCHVRWQQESVARKVGD